MIAAIIPAHDEAVRVERAIASLHRQTRPPERILVVSDEPTDATVDVALQAGAEVLLTVDNLHRRAGALNQALGTVRLADEDLVLLLGPEIRLPPGFLACARSALEDRNVGAVPARVGTADVAAALVRWRALEDVHRLLGRYCDEGPGTGRMCSALDLEAVGWRLAAPLDVGRDGSAATPVDLLPGARVQPVAA